MNTQSISHNYIEGTRNAFKFFLKRREIYNPRKATLKVWLEVNKSKLTLPDTVDFEDLADAVWEDLGTW